MNARLIGRRPFNSGFSLVEMLLAISILASVSVFGITILGTQMENRNDIARYNESQHILHAAMTRLYDDIRHVYHPTKKDAVIANVSRRKVKPALVSSRSEFYFTSQNFRSFLRDSPQSNLAVVGYTIRRDPNNSKLNQLVREVDTQFEQKIENSETKISLVLVPDLKEFKVTWWNGEDFREDWSTEQGDTREALPKMAKIELSIYNKMTDQQIQDLEEGSLKADERSSIAAESTVYLLYSKPFEQVKQQSKEYTWR